LLVTFVVFGKSVQANNKPSVSVSQASHAVVQPELMQEQTSVVSHLQ